jgi:Zn finger protein HypA/HybF involved in hydrogenase expression
MNNFQLWWHNLTNNEMNQYIVCPHCKKMQEKANWDYQRCNRCKKYMFDDRYMF